LRLINENKLSISDIEALDKAITDYGFMSFDQLQDLSHDQAWESADINDVISLEAIATTLPSSSDLVEHLREN
ncbi:MAG: type II toxin-antitoxin system antitoxin SocA domain-containing protein, partial [Blastocatellia bacterium]